MTLLVERSNHSTVNSYDIIPVLVNRSVPIGGAICRLSSKTKCHYVNHNLATILSSVHYGEIVHNFLKKIGDKNSWGFFQLINSRMMRIKDNKNDLIPESSEHICCPNLNSGMKIPTEDEEIVHNNDKHCRYRGNRNEIKRSGLFILGLLFVVLGSSVLLMETNNNRFSSGIRTKEVSKATQSNEPLQKSPQVDSGEDHSNQDVLKIAMTSKDKEDVFTTPVESSKVPKVTPQRKKNPNSKTVSFHVMGDVPYSRVGTRRLEQQVKEISQRVESGEDESSFIIHVGDFMIPSNTNCAEAYFRKPFQIFQEYCALPLIVTPGDNDYLDCPNPELAFSHFSKYFIEPVDTWRDRSHIPSILQRSETREENFVFHEKGVLFIGINMIPEPTKSPTFEERMSDNLYWMKSSLEKHIHESRAIVIFGHSEVGQRIFDPIKEVVSKTEIPLLYVHGNGHHFLESRLMGTKKMWNLFWRIQVDEGAKAPPLKITIRDPEDDTPFQVTNEHQRIYHDLIKIDRMGGQYS